MDKIKILIVDDHPMMRDALKISFTGEDDLQVIGEASNGIEALKLLETLTPDIILMDLLMPKMDGLETIDHIFKSNLQAKILVLSSMEDEERVVSAIQAGALGYFPKTAPRQYLLEAVRKVADGLPYMPSGITMKLFQGMRRMKTVPAASETQITITARQKEVLILMAEGKTDEEIGKTLHLQETTVRTHLFHIQQRLGLENRSQVMAYVHNHLKYNDGDITPT
jgi:two-component system, NarL family, response regulator LiaR